jgi:hypothetical protein
MKSRALAIAALILLAGCGGGGSSPATGPAQTPQTPNQTAPLQNSINLTVSFPVGGKSSSSSKRAPQYVSPSSTKIVVTVNSVNSGAVPSWVPATTSTTLNTGAGGNCTVSGGTETCTIPVAAPPGSVNYTISAEDGSNNVLATVTTTITIVQGTNNTPNNVVTLQGVVKTVSVTGAALTADTPANTGTPPGNILTVTAEDADSNQIVNGTVSANYANPITLTDNDATGSTKLSVNGGTASSAVTVNNPSDVVRVIYSGQAANNISITASGTGISGGGTISTNVSDIVFTGTTDDTTANGGLAADPNYGQQTVFFAQPSGSQNVSASEAGYTDSPYSKQFVAVPSGGCSGVASITPASPSTATTFTVTALGVGICSVRLEETGSGYPITQHTANTSGSETHDGTFWVSVTSANFTINGKRHQTQ